MLSLTSSTALLQVRSKPTDGWFGTRRYDIPLYNSNSQGNCIVSNTNNNYCVIVDGIQKNSVVTNINMNVLISTKWHALHIKTIFIIMSLLLFIVISRSHKTSHQKEISEIHTTAVSSPLRSTQNMEIPLCHLLWNKLEGCWRIFL